MSDQDQALTVIPVNSEAQRFLPVMSMVQAIDRREIIVTAVKRLMREGHDYGKVPGGGDKPVLLQPGAQKLDNLFGLTPRYDIVSQVEDWTGENHGGEPFFSYTVKCHLWRGEYLMGEAIGSCNSWEAKYRWRKAERVCPACGKDTIIKGKAEYGGGWLCFAKKGGCGAKYKAGDVAIESQETGRKPNADICDQINTILKIAEKRAHLSATTGACSASEFFTVDLDPVDGTDDSAPAPTWAEGEAAAQAVRDEKVTRMKAGESYQDVSGPDPKSPRSKPEVLQSTDPVKESVEQAKANIAPPFKYDKMLAAFADIKKQFIEDFGDDGKAAYYRVLGAMGYLKSNEIRSASEGKRCFNELKQCLSDMQAQAKVS